MKQGDYVKLTKISDEVFNGLHPNGIYTGYSQLGVLEKDVTVGERCNVVNPRRFHDYLSTSKVTQIIDENTFRTENSIYRIEIVPEPEVKPIKLDDDRIMVNFDWGN